MSRRLGKVALQVAAVVVILVGAIIVFVPLDRPPASGERFQPAGGAIDGVLLVAEEFWSPPLTSFIDSVEAPIGAKYEDVVARHGEQAFAGIRSELRERDVIDKESLHLLDDGAASWRAYFGTVHSHSALSDGKGTAEEAFRFARDFAKLDFMALTDHPEYWLFSSESIWDELAAAADDASTQDFVALRGFEYSSAIFGHYVVLETPSFCSSLRCRDLDKFYEWLSEPAQQSALVFFAHPGFMNRVRSQFEFDHFRFVPELQDNFVGIEVMHWDGYKRFLNGPGGRPFLDAALEQGWLLGASAAEDNHALDWGMAGNKRLGVLLQSLSREDLVAGLRQRRFYATNNENLQLAFYLQGKDDKTRFMGEHIAWNEVDPGRLELNVRYLDPDGRHGPKRLELVVNGEVMAARNFDARTASFDFGEQLNHVSGHWRVTMSVKTANDGALPDLYAYVRLYQGDRERIFTHTSPIFLSKGGDGRSRR